MLLVLIILIVIILAIYAAKRGNAEKRPYRLIAECYLIYGDKIVAQPNPKYISFPGGGVDEGESIIEGAKRELMEEVGAVVKDLKEVHKAYYEWIPEWYEGSEKRKKRYEQFRGEEIHMLFGVVEKFVTPTSTEGDAWKGEILIDPQELLKKHKQTCARESAAMKKVSKAYRAGQQKMIKYCIDHIN